MAAQVRDVRAILANLRRKLRCPFGFFLREHPTHRSRRKTDNQRSSGKNTMGMASVRTGVAWKDAYGQGVTTHEALWAKDLFEKGIGWVIVARFKSAGQRVEAGVFLVDAWCLGAKWVAYESCDRQDYLERIRAHYESEFVMAAVEPCCARKLVEQAAQYAQALGFAPHPDYKKAARVFGGIDVQQCAQQFTFGRDGKPFYCRGPKETEERARQILAQLERRCGPGNYHFMIGMGGSDDLNQVFD